jgi:broad specificity phosphatase PhoE
MKLLLVRHGESVGNITQVLQSREEPLTERGREQARQVAAHLATRDDVAAIYASPLARALETSQIIGTAVELTPRPDEALAEISVGDAAGLTFQEWSARLPEEATRFHKEGLDYAFPGGESGRQLGARTAAAIDRIIATHRHEPGAVVIVSHGGALSWILGHLLRESGDAWPSHTFDNCSITEVEIDPEHGGASTVVCQNAVGHLLPNPDEEVATGRLP